MSTITSNQIRIAALILLVSLLSLAAAAQRQLMDSLHNLAAGGATSWTLSQSLTSDAGAPALVLLNADALVLAMNGGTTTLTARARDEVGKPVPGVEVHFQSDRGSVTPARATTDAAGLVRATFTAGGQPGQAVITAQANGIAQQTTIQIAKPNSDAAKYKLALEFGATKLDPGQQATFSAVLRDASGQPAAGELVSLFGSLGEVAPASVMSDANGRVSASYRAGNAPGQAMITVLAGYATQSVAFQVGDLATPTPTGTGDEHSLYLPLVTR